MASLLAKEAADYIAEKLLIHKDTEACRDTLCSIVTALHNINNKNPNDQLPGFGIYTASYLVHRLASETKSWYGVLGFKDHPGAGVEEIKKHYEVLAKLFDDQPETCSSVEVKRANKLVGEAWEVLSDARKREAYDMLMGFNNNNNVVVQFFSPEASSRNPSPASSSSSSAAAAAASSPLPAPSSENLVAMKIVRNRIASVKWPLN